MKLRFKISTERTRRNDKSQENLGATLRNKLKKTFDEKRRIIQLQLTNISRKQRYSKYYLELFKSCPEFSQTIIKLG